MKRLLLILILSAAIFQLHSYDKKSLVERFTNASCAPCASLNNSWYNATTQNLVNTGAMNHIIYNVNWPGPNDPMYLLNATDNMNRRTYYGVSWVPWPVVNGTYFDYQTMGQSQFVSTINNANTTYSPFEIDITQMALGDNLIKVKVKITREVGDVTTFTNAKLRVALTEKTVSYPTPPGSNGESEFYSVCRKMLPDGNGTSFTIPAPGAFTEIELEYVPTTAFLNAVNLDSIRVIAFIQDDPSKTFYQSSSLDLVPNFVAFINPSSPDVILENNGTAQLSAGIKNIGMMEDTYDVTCTLEAPAGWTGTFTTPNGTFPFGGSDAVTVASGDSVDILVNVEPSGINGFGKVIVDFTSQNNPGLSGSTFLRVVTQSGIDVLVVDGSSDDYGSHVASSLENTFSGTYGVISASALEVPSIDLSNFVMITWTTGTDLPVFVPQHITALEAYLDNGGRLFISGQDVGNDIFGAGGQSQHAQSFYNNYLHANFVANTSTSFLVKGIAGDPITDGLSFVPGFLYDKSLDMITPNGPDATSIFTYLNGPNIAGIKASTTDYKVVYLAFGFEQIDQSDIKDTLMARISNWLLDGITVDVEDEFVVNTYSLDQNYPNPFNPSTTIRYSLEKESDVNITVYDVMGSEVMQLVNGRQSAGRHSVNLNASALSSGVYFYKITAGDFTASKKMILMK